MERIITGILSHFLWLETTNSHQDQFWNAEVSPDLQCLQLSVQIKPRYPLQLQSFCRNVNALLSPTAPELSSAELVRAETPKLAAGEKEQREPIVRWSRRLMLVKDGLNSPPAFLDVELLDRFSGKQTVCIFVSSPRSKQVKESSMKGVNWL